MVTNENILQILCAHWSIQFKTCRLKFNQEVNSPLLKFSEGDFKKDCNGYCNNSECVWFTHSYVKNRDFNQVVKEN